MIEFEVTKYMMPRSTDISWEVLDVQRWITEHVTGAYHLRRENYKSFWPAGSPKRCAEAQHFYIVFEDQNDAFAFKMRWT
jgi:hypothetical protein